jgi:hypothetical protein
MPNGATGDYELTIALSDPRELFDAPAYDVAAGTPPGLPGIDRIREELRSQPIRGQVTVAVVLPAGEATPRVERGLRESIARYCDAGIARAEIELRAIRRDGIQTLFFGAIVLAGFLALSEAVLRSTLPKELRDFFGNGLFLVAAWVGLWYPLDTLLYSGRPCRSERKLLRMIRAIEIVVRPAGED